MLRKPAAVYWLAEKLRVAISPFMAGEHRWTQIESGLEDVFIGLMETAKDNFS